MQILELMILLFALPLSVVRLLASYDPRRMAGERRFQVAIVVLGACLAIASWRLPQFRPLPMGISFSRMDLLLVLEGFFLAIVIMSSWLGWLREKFLLKMNLTSGKLVKCLQLVLMAFIVGTVEEIVFRGIWGLLSGPITANFLYVLFCAIGVPLTHPQYSLRNISFISLFLFSFSLFMFGLSLSWIYQSTGLLALPIGIHSGIYFAFRQWPQSDSGLSFRSWKYWSGWEAPAQGIVPIFLYWGIAGSSLLLFYR